MRIYVMSVLVDDQAKALNFYTEKLGFIVKHAFKVDDLKKEFERLRHFGVEFTVEPMDAGTVRMAVFDDTCGNLIQLVEMIEGR